MLHINQIYQDNKSAVERIVNTIYKKQKKKKKKKAEEEEETSKYREMSLQIFL